MRATHTVTAADQARDLAQVTQLWHDLGHTHGSVDVYRYGIRLLLRRARITDYRQLSADRVVRLARAHARERHADPTRAQRAWLVAFRAFSWGLERLGQITGPVALSKPVERERDPVVAAFAEYARRMGWAPHTLAVHRRYIAYLRRFQRGRRAPWPVPRLNDIDQFLAGSAARWKRTTVAGAASTCRAWLRFLFVTGRVRRDLAASVALPRSISFSSPARALPWETIRALRHGIDTRTPMGRRDLAQYLLLCAYGLSNAEVIGLTLDDIDWDRGILHIRRVKNGATLDLPLAPAVAKAVATYVRSGRPVAADRHVFLRHTIPFGPLGHSTVGQRVKCWATRARVDMPFLGTHLFRHSVATHQLELGTPLKVIGDILGHRSVQTTGIYVRTALERLRPLALPVPR